MGRRTDHKKKKKKKTSPIEILFLTIGTLIGLGLFAYIMAFPKTTETPATPTTTANTQTTETKQEKPLNLPSQEERNNLNIPILMYHLVNDTAGSLENLYLRETELESQLQYLKEAGYTGITFKDLQAYWEGKKALPEKPIILSFDDGDPSVYEKALPILEKYGFVSTQFIIAGLVGTDAINEDQIKEFVKKGHEIGSHSMTHIDLSSASSSALESEIKGSKEALEKITGQEVTSFCYPAGKFSDAAVKSLEDNGYKGAVTTINGIANKTKQGAFELERIRISRGDTGDVLKEKLGN